MQIKPGSSGNYVGKVNRYGVGRRHSGLSGICPLSIYWLQEDSGQAGMTTSMLSTGKPEEALLIGIKSF